MSPGGKEVAVLDRWFTAFNAHDLDALCAIADADIEVIPLPDANSASAGATYHGLLGLRTLLEASFERFPSLRVEHAPLQASGGRVTVDLRFVLDDGESAPKIRNAACDYRIRNGRIRRMRAFERTRTSDERDARALSDALSPRECEVLSLIAGGRTVSEIATDLDVSPLTVRTHVRNAKDKLRARTTPQAVAIAIEENALDL